MKKTNIQLLSFLVCLYTLGIISVFLFLSRLLFLELNVENKHQLILSVVIVALSTSVFGSFTVFSRMLGTKYFQYVLFIVLFLTDLEFRFFRILDRNNKLRASILSGFFIFSVVFQVTHATNYKVYGFLLAYLIIYFFTALIEVSLSVNVNVSATQKTCIGDDKFTFMKYLVHLSAALSCLSPVSVDCRLPQFFAHKEFVGLGLAVHYLSKNDEKN